MAKTCVALLQEFCQQNKHQPPLYEEFMPERSGNSIVFKWKVRVPEQNCEAIGTCVIFLVSN